MVQVIRVKTSNSSLKTRGAAAPRTRITWRLFLGLEEPSLKLLRSSELQRTNSSPISNCRRLKSAIFISCNINSNINSLLLLRVGIRIISIYLSIYLSDERYISEVEMKTNKTSNSSLKTRGAAAPRTRITWRLFRFRRTFVEVITFGGASAHEF